MIDRNEAIAMAKDLGFDLWIDGDSGHTVTDIGIKQLHALVNAAYRRGLEDAAALVQANAEACVDGSMTQVYLASNAHAIRAMKEKK